MSRTTETPPNIQKEEHNYKFRFKIQRTAQLVQIETYIYTGPHALVGCESPNPA